MTNQTLSQLYAEHSGKVSDKWSIYLAEYGRIFGELRNKPVTLLEIGVQNGGSIEVWTKYFANAQKFVGCDINPDCTRLIYEDPRVAVIIGDANSDAVQSMVLNQASVFDVIIDDGSHRSSDIVKSFARYFPYLADGGVFVAEDLHCSYWAEFEGGLFDPFSSISFFKRLVDIINHEHWGIDKARSDILRGFFLNLNFQIDEDVLTHIHSIEFVNSMCVVRKESPQKNSLGIRVFSGIDEAIVPRGLTQHSSTSSTPSQIGNEWTARIIPPDEDVLRLEKEITTCDEQIALLVTSKEMILKSLVHLEKDKDQLEKEIDKRDEQIAFLASSMDMILNTLSWRITKPLRFVRSLNLVKRILYIFGI
jgi:hypothetical protein